MDYSKLNTYDLVIVVNGFLSKDSKLSVNKIGDLVNIPSSSLKQKIKKSGYIYDKEIRQYVIKEDKSLNEVDLIADKVCEKLEVLLNLKMDHRVKCDEIKITSRETMVTSIRVNKELLSMVKAKCEREGDKLIDVIEDAFKSYLR